MSGESAKPESSIAGFRFVEQPGEVPAASTFIANIPAGVRRKQMLLHIFADQLEFPEYFSNNWDSLEECLRDLSWLRASNIQIHHRDIPLPLGSQDRRIYLQILQSASTFWSVSILHRFESVFPAKCRAEVLSLRA